jgi:dienelactone hydrolase
MKMIGQAFFSVGPVSGKRRRLLVLLSGSVALLAACGGPRPAQREEIDSELSRFVSRGYDPAVTVATYPFRATWQQGDEKIILDLLLPRGTVAAPLVIYLPGLGEPVQAGETWRRSWAQAGYAVASIQTPDGAPPRPAGRDGDDPGKTDDTVDHAGVAREQFAVKSLAARLERVAFVVQGMTRRAQGGDSIYGQIDTSRVAVAGFDLGAQTALALAGERHPGLAARPALPGLRAVIALSPSAILARGGFVERFGGISLPTLAITGTEDQDPNGLVESPFTRQAPYRYMPPGDKYLLVVEDGTHLFLSGGSRAFASRERGNGAPAEAPPDGERREPPGDMGGGGGPGGPGGGMGGRGGPGQRAGGQRDEAALQRAAASGAQRQSVIVQRTSLAFLDAVVKNDPVAREWLVRDAARWSDPLARLEMK